MKRINTITFKYTTIDIEIPEIINIIVCKLEDPSTIAK